jgi:REP element-mobilizing transposase RayT
MFITRDGAFYRQFLPHYRSPGCIYHCRFSLDPLDGHFRFTEGWMFAIVEASILREHKKECMIHAYIVMADHSHVVVQPLPKVNDPSAWCDYRSFYPLERITGRIKGRSARLINQRSARSGRLWQGESYDRTIRNMRDLENTIDYVHHNPVRWKIVESPEQYRWSSLRTIYSGDQKYHGWFDLEYVSKRMG